MAEAALKIAVNTEEITKAVVAMDKLDATNISAIKTLRAMEYKMMDLGKSVSNVEKVTREITDTTGKYYNSTQLVKDGLIKVAKELDAQTDATKRATVAANDSIKANNGANTSYKGTGGAIRNVSYQIQDFATQVGAGTSAATALGQQLPQLLSGFGLMGVVIGTATAVIIPLINSLGIFDSATDKAGKSLDRFQKELSDIAKIGDDVGQFAKDFSATSADGFVKYVEVWNKASASQRKEMETWLKQKILYEEGQLLGKKREASGTTYDFLARQGLNVGKGTILQPDGGRLFELNVDIRKREDELKRLKAAAEGDFGTATAGAKATSEQKSQESLIQTYDRKVATIQAEANALQISNVEKKLSIELANLEIDKNKLGAAEYLRLKDAITQAVYARNTSEETKKIKEYSDAQLSANEILADEAKRLTMTTREYQKYISEKQFAQELNKQTIGMSPEGKAQLTEVATGLFQTKQAILDINDAQKRTFQGGALEAMRKYGEDASNIGTQVGNTFANAFKGMEDAVVQFTMTGKASFSSFALSVIADIQRILVRQALLAPIAGGLTSLLGTIGGSLAGSAAGGASSSFGSITAPSGTSSFGSLNSGVSQGFGIRAYAVGTNYVPNDQLAMIHKGEAIVPAAYNPAAGGIGGGNINNVTVNVSTGGGQDSSTSNSQDASKLGALISNVVKATIIKEQRNGGLLSGA